MSARIYWLSLIFPEINEPDARRGAVADVIEKCTAYRDEMFANTREATHSLEKMTAYFASCVNCYNCRVACPVCSARNAYLLPMSSIMIRLGICSGPTARA